MSVDTDRLKEIKDNYKESVDGFDHIYKSASDDMQFVYDVGEGQWPAEIRNERQKAGRPVLTINKLQKTLRRIRGDHKMNPTQIKVLPVDDKADVETAKLYNGLIREIEYLSNAEIAYDTAYNHAISASIGFWRIITKYVDGGNAFDQEISIKRILNFLSVHFDPYAQEFNYEDARYCFVEDLMKKEDFKKKYPNAEVIDFESTTTATLFGDWMQGDNVRVAEYFYKEPVKQKMVMLETGEIIPVNAKITIDAIKHLGGVIVKERTVETNVVKWCKISGAEILEESEWPTDDIPIIPMFGDEIVVNGKRYYISLTRGATDPQRMYNYWAVAGTETVALAPKNPFIMDHRQVKGFENEWDESNRTNRIYVRYNAVAGLQKPAREPQTQVPTAIMAMMQATAYDVEDHLGQYEASKGEASNERSRVAIMARVQQSDKGTFLFVDNSTRSKICGGKQIIKLIPKIYDTKRALRIRGEGGEEELVTVNDPTLDASGAVVKKNDLSIGKYDLIATVGASFSSKRQEMVQTMTDAMQYAPSIAPLIAPLIFKYSDSPGSQEIYAELKKGIEQQQQQAMQMEQMKNSGGVPPQ
jgi:hypothetical protein